MDLIGTCGQNTRTYKVAQYLRHSDSELGGHSEDVHHFLKCVYLRSRLTHSLRFEEVSGRKRPSRSMVRPSLAESCGWSRCTSSEKVTRGTKTSSCVSHLVQL